MKEKGFAPLIIMLGILIILGIACGAYYLGTIRNKPKIQNPIVTSQATPTARSAQTTPVPLSDETANWPSHTNSYLHYAIKYPTGWQIKTCTYGQDKNGATISADNFAPVGGRLGMCSTPPPAVHSVPGIVYIQFAQNGPSNFDSIVGTWRTNGPNLDKNFQIQNAQVAGRRAVRMVKHVEPETATWYYIDLGNNLPQNNTLQVEYDRQSGEQDYTPLFDEMLSTLTIQN